MSPDAAHGGPPRSSPGRGTYGDYAFASLLLTAVSGVALALPYDVHDAYGSVATLVLTNPGAVFFRNLHSLAAQAFLALTALHMWDHLRQGTEQRVRRGPWWRLTALLPVAAFLMISGFILKGDPEGRQALRILVAAAGEVPVIGWWLSASVFGVGGRLQVVYLHHAATATLVAWLFTVEHARSIWPRSPAVFAAFVPLAALALVWSPGLHDGLSKLIKGPWFFLGLQELLHWTTRPIVIVLLGLSLLALVGALPDLPRRLARLAKGLLAAILACYLVLCAVGVFFRGESWAWKPAWRSDTAPSGFGWIAAARTVSDSDIPVPIPAVLGRPEGCLVCHKAVTGLGPSHRPEAVGCASCHGGNPFSLRAAVAHAGMFRVPGNLAESARTCGLTDCHASIVPRVERSLMTTFRGAIEVDRRVWGEAPSGTVGLPHVADLGASPADSHLRQLCASCHLGASKMEPGPVHEDSRGGGCTACHLTYDPASLAALRAYEAARRSGTAEPPSAHPALGLDIGDDHCFGCHSRSGRISTSYEGWHETPLVAVPGEDRPSRYRLLEDGRVFVREMPDIHQQKGLDCIDCHTAGEVMGDGRWHGRKRDQVRIACEDCHAKRGGATVPAARLDPESRRLLALRGRQVAPTDRFLLSWAAGPLVNTLVGADLRPWLWRKRTAQPLELRAPAPVCVEGKGHARLSCVSCHTAWAPRCPACHTAFDASRAGYDLLAGVDTKGAWVETPGLFEVVPPTLGMRAEIDERGTRHEVVDTFTPGMILTIDRNRVPGRGADPVFHRLYARGFAHTISTAGRGCRSCHNDPVAIGYGRGELQYVAGPTGGRWRFTPASPPSAEDGLPADAWTGFLQERHGMVSTRADVRPFNAEEQRRILRVGACLTCHREDSAVMRQSVRDFAEVRRRVTPRCLLPRW